MIWGQKVFIQNVANGELFLALKYFVASLFKPWWQSPNNFLHPILADVRSQILCELHGRWGRCAMLSRIQCYAHIGQAFWRELERFWWFISNGGFDDSSVMETGTIEFPRSIFPCHDLSNENSLDYTLKLSKLFCWARYFSIIVKK